MSYSDLKLIKVETVVVLQILFGLLVNLEQKDYGISRTH